MRDSVGRSIRRAAPLSLRTRAMPFDPVAWDAEQRGTFESPSRSVVAANKGDALDPVAWDAEQRGTFESPNRSVVATNKGEALVRAHWKFQPKATAGWRSIG